MARERSQRDYQRNYGNALGICVITGMFAMETVVAHNVHPNPASPIVWTALGTVAVVAGAACLWFKAKAKSTATASR